MGALETHSMQSKLCIESPDSIVIEVCIWRMFWFGGEFNVLSE